MGKIKHGMWGSRTYSTYYSMKSRCYNPNETKYERYGGRGITVCERWLQSFDNFLSDMGERPEGRTIDRIDNDKGYYPGNCRWATITENNLNRSSCVSGDLKRRVIHALKRVGIETKAEVARLTGYSEEVVRYHIRKEGLYE